MADIEDVHLDPRRFNKNFSDDLKAATAQFHLSNDQFNAVKHAGVSAVLTDVTGGELAKLFGDGVEFIQDIRGFVDQTNVSDDHRDTVNNAIGREFAKRNPSLSAQDYYKAMAFLAQSGNLVEDRGFRLPTVKHPRAKSRRIQRYLGEVVERALDKDTIGLFANPLDAKNPSDLNGPEGKVFDLPGELQTYRQRSNGQGRSKLKTMPAMRKDHRRLQSEFSRQDAANPFDLNNQKLKQQAEMLERNPLRARQMILAAGRDPELFRV